MSYYKSIKKNDFIFTTILNKKYLDTEPEFIL